MWWTSGENNLNFLYRRYWSNSSIFWTSQEINKQGWLEFRAIGLENMFHIKGAATPCSSTLLLGRNGAMIVQSSDSLREARNQMLCKVSWFLNVGNWFNSVLVFVFFFFPFLKSQSQATLQSGPEGNEFEVDELTCITMERSRRERHN